MHDLEIAPLEESELGQLFGLAKTVFATASGWSDRRVLDALARDVVFVAHEQGADLDEPPRPARSLYSVCRLPRWHRNGAS